MLRSSLIKLPFAFFATNHFESFKKKMTTRGRGGNAKIKTESVQKSYRDEEIKSKPLKKDIERTNEEQPKKIKKERRRDLFNEDNFDEPVRKPRKKEYYEVRKVERNKKKAQEHDRVKPNSPKYFEKRKRREIKFSDEEDYKGIGEKRFNHDKSPEPPPKKFIKAPLKHQDYRMREKSEDVNLKASKKQELNEVKKKAERKTHSEKKTKKLIPKVRKDTKKELNLSFNLTQEEIKKTPIIELLLTLSSKEYCSNANPDTLLNIIQYLTENDEIHIEGSKSKEINYALKTLLSKERIHSLTNEQLSIIILILLKYKIDYSEFWKLIYPEVLSRKNSLSTEDIIEILSSFRRIIKVTEFTDVNKIFNEFEDVILNACQKGKVSPKQLQKLVKVYSKNNKGTANFFKKLESIILTSYESMTERVRANILLSLSTLNNIDNEFFEKCKSKVIKAIESKNIKENSLVDEDSMSPTVFTNFLLSYHNRNLLDKEMLEKTENRLLEKYESFYIANTPTLYSIFVSNKAIHNPEKAFNFINDCIKENVEELNIEHMIGLFTNWTAADCPLNLEVKKKIVQHLIEETNNPKGQSKGVLRIIYNNIKDCSKSDPAYSLKFKIASLIETKTS